LNAAVEPDASAAPVTAAEAETLFSPFAAEPAVLAAVSGGPDSVALLALLARWAQGPGRPRLHAATVDHGLRPEAAAEARLVADLCARLGAPHAILTWGGEKPVTGVQARARAARYALLGREAARLGAATLVTGHTLDDQAETVLMRMAHGSGPAGLAGMRAISRRDGLTIARPLLGLPKARLLATLREQGLDFAEDPSNRDLRFERVRWRALTPALGRAGLDAARLGLLASRLARMNEALDQRAMRLWPELVASQSEGSLELRFAALLDEPDEIALRVLAHGLDRIRGDGLARLERLESCLSGLRHAARSGLAMTRTLSGCVLRLGRDGVLLIAPEPARRRGVHPAAS
jgi:tRNA(Ile)-lysidine synthase